MDISTDKNVVTFEQVKELRKRRQQLPEEIRHALEHECHREPAKRAALELALLFVEKRVCNDTAYFALKHIHKLAWNMARRTIITGHFHEMFDDVYRESGI